MMKALEQICNKRCGEIIFTAEKTLQFVCLLCDTDYVGSSDYLMHILLAHNIVDLNESDDLDFEKGDGLEVLNDDEALKSFEEQSADISALDEDGSQTEYSTEDDTCSDSDTSEDSTQSGCPKEPKERYPFKCELCPAKFMKQERLQEHKQTHNELQCLVCSEEFPTKGALKYHKITKHPKEAQHQCSDCGATFVSSKGYELHLMRHRKEKNVKCLECGKYFYNFYIKKHMISHENLRKFVCPLCGASFKTDPALKKHLRGHENKREHVCQLCGYGFNDMSNLNRHMRIGCKGKPQRVRRAHLSGSGLPNEERKKERDVKCEICGKLFYKTTIKAHMVCHENLRNFVCNRCGKAFSRDAALQKHLRAHDNRREHVCQLCGFGFNEAGNLRRHMQKCNGTPPPQKKRPLGKSL